MNYLKGHYDLYENHVTEYWNSLICKETKSNHSFQLINLLKNAINELGEKFNSIEKEEQYVSHELIHASNQNNLIKIQFLINYISAKELKNQEEALINSIEKLIKCYKNETSVFHRLSLGIIEQATDVLSDYTVDTFDHILMEMYEMANIKNDYDILTEAVIKGMQCLTPNQKSIDLLNYFKKSIHIEIVEEAEFVLEDFRLK